PAPAPTNTVNLRVLATHSTGPPLVDVQFDSIASLVPNVSVGRTNVTIGIGQTQPVGGTGVRVVFSIGCQKAARVKFKVNATVVGPAQPEQVSYEIVFGGNEPPSVNPPAADVNDHEHPRVILTTPQEGSRAVAPGAAIFIRF